MATSPIAQSNNATSATRIEPLAARREALRDLAVVGVACLLFLGISLYQLDLPGLYTDEAYDVIPAMQMVLGHPVELQGGVLDLGGLHLPLMSSSAYQGVTYTYLALPFFALGGVNVFSLRLMTVLVGALGVVLAYFLGRSWFGREVGCVTALLLALSPAWIFWSRLGVYVVSIVAPIAMGALLAFTYWVRRRRTRGDWPLYLGMLLLGLGLTTKLLFLWYIAAVILTALLLYGRLLWENRKLIKLNMQARVRVALFSALWFAVGAFPFILYNVLTRGTLDLLRQTLSGGPTTSYGVDNLAVVRNLWTAADSFKVMLDGGYFWFQGAGQQPYANPFPPSIFAISAIGLLALSLARRAEDRQMKSSGYAPAVASVGIALLLSFTLAITSASEAFGTLLTIAAVALTLGGAAALAWMVLRARVAVAQAGWVLLATMTLAGALWWFGGGGRPDTRAPGAFLGLWPIDVAGILFWVSGAALLTILGTDREPAPLQRPTVAALTIIGLLVAQSAVTISGLWGTHLLLALPLPQVLIGAFAVAITRRIGSRAAKRREKLPWRWVRVLPAALLLGAALAGDAVVDGLYQRDLAATGGASTFSDAIYSLNNYLQTSKAGYKVVAMDWGFRRPLQFLSQERIVPIEGYGLSAQPPPEFYTSLRGFIKDEKTVYLFHTMQGTAYPRRDAFLKEVAAAGKVAVPDATFKHRDGTPVYELYTVR